MPKRTREKKDEKERPAGEQLPRFQHQSDESHCVSSASGARRRITNPLETKQSVLRRVNTPAPQTIASKEEMHDREGPVGNIWLMYSKVLDLSIALWIDRERKSSAASSTCVSRWAGTPRAMRRISSLPTFLPSAILHHAPSPHYLHGFRVHLWLGADDGTGATDLRANWSGKRRKSLRRSETARDLRWISDHNPTPTSEEEEGTKKKIWGIDSVVDLPIEDLRRLSREACFGEQQIKMNCSEFCTSERASRDECLDPSSAKSLTHGVERRHERRSERWGRGAGLVKNGVLRTITKKK